MHISFQSAEAIKKKKLLTTWNRTVVCFRALQTSPSLLLLAKKGP